MILNEKVFPEFLYQRRNIYKYDEKQYILEKNIDKLFGNIIKGYAVDFNKVFNSIDLINQL